MRKKFRISLGLAGLLAVLTVIQVIAGSSFDFGELSGAPPVGEANWTAWPTLINLVNGRPNEILTEDNTNCGLGENLGYSEYDGDPNIEWWMQVENLLTPIPTDQIQILFGGLGSYSGTLWKYSFSWDPYSYFETDHGIVPIQTTAGNACPTTSEQPVEEPADPAFGRTFVFSGSEPGATYHIYRSRNASGAENGASNGQYFWIATIELPDGEYGSYFTDLEEFDGPAWYLVIKADPNTNEIIGCHSEESDPTADRIINFEAVYNPDLLAVDLTWEKSDPNVIGFNVFRSTEPGDSNPDQINTEEIPAGEDVTFDYVDDDIIIGETYYYWIEVRDNEDNYEKVGPRSVRPGFFIFLPVIN